MCLELSFRTPWRRSPGLAVLAGSEQSPLHLRDEQPGSPGPQRRGWAWASPIYNLHSTHTHTYAHTTHSAHACVRAHAHTHTRLPGRCRLCTLVASAWPRPSTLKECACLSPPLPSLRGCQKSHSRTGLHATSRVFSSAPKDCEMCFPESPLGQARAARWLQALWQRSCLLVSAFNSG